MHASWDFLCNLAQNTMLPWYILRDFNDILDAHEKHIGFKHTRWFVNGC